MSRTTDPAKIQLWQSRFKQFQNSKLTIERFCDSVDCCVGYVLLLEASACGLITKIGSDTS